MAQPIYTLDVYHNDSDLPDFSKDNIYNQEDEC